MNSAWFTKVFAAAHPRAVVTEVLREEVIATTATKVRFKLSYNEVGEAAGLPRRVVAKGALYGHRHEAQLNRLYCNEARFYRDVAPQLGLDTPRCYYTDPECSGLILLEDLKERGASFGSPARAMSVATVAQGLDYQAQYHARYWNQREALDGLKLLDIDGFLRSYFRHPFLIDFEPPQGTHSRETLSAVQTAREAIQDRRFFEQAVLVLHAHNEREVQCLTHFDAHAGNMYFDAAGAPCWLDWQSCARYAWGWDVAYFIIGALSLEDRRTHERELLEHYLQCLRRQGVGQGVPSYEAAWLSYRRHAIWGLIWALIPHLMQSHTDGFPVVERFWTAVRDLRPLQCLGLSARGAWAS